MTPSLPRTEGSRADGWVRTALSRGAVRSLRLIGFLVALAGAAPGVAAEAVASAPAGPGAEVLPVPPGRIVSLAPSVTEVLFALGAGDRVVGVSSQCDAPAEVQHKPRAGTYLQPNVERIVALEPDLVVAVPSPGNRAAVEHLRRLGIEVLVVPEGTLADAWEAIVVIGGRIGAGAAAEQLVGGLKTRIEAVRIRSAGYPRRRVLFVVGREPLIAVGTGLFLDELISLAGGDNVANSSGLPWPRLTLEAVVAAAPEVIIDGSMGSESGGDLASWWGAYRSVPAVREGRLRGAGSDALLRAGPRLAEAAETLFALIHDPDAPQEAP